MVILVGGSSHVGKTLVAQRLLEKYKYQCLSLDHLKMAFIRSGRTQLTVNDDYEMRYWLWPFVAELIKTAIENDQNLIIEGCYIPGEWAQSFTEDYLKEIRCAFIVMSERYMRTKPETLGQYANVIEHRIADHIDLERLILCSKYFKEDCIKSNTRYIEIDTQFSEKALVDAMDQIISSPCTFGDGIVI